VRKFSHLDWAEVAVDLKKLLVFACLFTGYLSGILAGGQVAAVLGIKALFIPASVTGVGGLTFSFVKASCFHVFERAVGGKLAHDLQAAEEIFDRARLQIQDLNLMSSDDNIGDEVHKALSLLNEMENSLVTKLTSNASAISLSLQSNDKGASPERRLSFYELIKCESMRSSRRSMHAVSSMQSSRNSLQGQAIYEGTVQVEVPVQSPIVGKGPIEDA